LKKGSYRRTEFVLNYMTNCVTSRQDRIWTCTSSL